MASSLPAGQWWIGLDGWVLQDGNYSDFAPGTTRRFALEFWAPSVLVPALPGPPSARFTGRGTTYDVTAEVLRTTPEPMADAFVLDAGVGAYAEWMPVPHDAGPAAGDWVSGEVALAVDHFAYMEYLAGRPGMPALIHTWDVLEVQLDTTPTIRVGPGHPLFRGPAAEGPHAVRDPERESYRTIDRTRRWDDGGAGYRLRCRLRDAPPTHCVTERETHPPPVA